MSNGLNLKEYQAVLFDVDGTLVDSLEALIAGLGDTFERFTGNRPSDDDLKAIIGMPLRTQLKLFQESEPDPERMAAMTEYTLERFEANVYLEREFGPAIQALELCRRGGRRTALVTSKSAVELSSFMKRFRGAPSCDVTVCASDVDQPKPHPESAMLACRRLGVEPSQAVMIGDSVFDMRCGRQAGASTVAVLYGSGRREDLLAEAPDLVIETPSDLLEWIQNSLSTPCPERR